MGLALNTDVVLLILPELHCTDIWTSIEQINGKQNPQHTKLNLTIESSIFHQGSQFNILFSFFL